MAHGSTSIEAEQQTLKIDKRPQKCQYKQLLGGLAADHS
jgi:hypothetical protein